MIIHPHRLGGICLVLFVAIVWSPPPTFAQGLIDQEAVGDLLSRNRQALNDLPAVHHDYHVFGAEHTNTILAWQRLYRHLGGGDVNAGRRRARTTALLNRTAPQQFSVGDTLVVPTRFGLDVRAYSPFPRYYVGGHENGNCWC
jgi:hypothetical protein